MYSHRELTRLGAHKAALRQRIARRRIECAAVATRALQPVAWLDRMVALWRRVAPFAPFAALPLGFLFPRPAAKRAGLLGPLLRWGPVLFGVVRHLTGAARR